MRAERRQVLLQALVVAHVGEHDVEETDGAPGLARHRDPGADHQRGEPHRLQRDRLAAGVRAADDDRALRLEHEIARDDVRQIERQEEVPRALEVEARLVDDLREDEGLVARQLRRRRPDVRDRQRPRGRVDARERVGHDGGEPRVDGLLLALHVRLEHLQAIAHGDDGARLDEQRGAAGARRVHDPGEPLVRVAPHRQHPAPLALGHEVILEDPLVARHHVLHAGEHPLTRGVPLAPELAEARAGAVGQRAVRVEAPGDLVGHLVERGIGRARVEERRHFGPPRREKATERPRRAEETPHRAELRRREDPADAGALDRLLDVLHLSRRQRPSLLEEARRLGGLGQQASRLVPRRGEGEILRQLLAERARASLGQGRQHAVPLQIGAGLRRARVEAERLHGGR